jgi:hypothetical protein
MPTARQSAANSFYFDDEGNIQRTPTHGTYGFRGFWEDRKEFSGGLPMDYDWKKLDRPDVHRAPAGPWRRPQPIQRGKETVAKGKQTARDVRDIWARPGEEPRDYGPPDEQDISGFASDPRPSGRGRFKNRTATPSGPGSAFNHTLTNVRVAGMDTVAGEMSGTSGALPRGSQFAGAYVEPQLAIGPGGGNFPGAGELRRGSDPGSTTNRRTSGPIG